MLSPYKALHRYRGHIGRLKDIVGLLQWDLETVMPKGAVAVRTEQLSALQVQIHRLESSDEFGKLVDRAAEQADLDGWQKANIDRCRRSWAVSRAVPTDLVDSFTRACTDCLMVWRDAKPNDDFASIEKPLQQVVDLARKKAEHRAGVLSCSPYEALVDEFEPSLSTKKVDAWFDELATWLPSLLEQAQSGNDLIKPLPSGPYSIATQQDLCFFVSTELGFDVSRGRFDQSAHPFCGGSTDDVRITTRYDENDFTSALFATIHETGHALYEQGLPKDWQFQPVGQASSTALHESQSLLWEMQVARSRPMAKWLLPHISDYFPEIKILNEHDFYRSLTTVRPSLIRVNADEVSYPAHVIARYRIEVALFDGSLNIVQLPQRWREEMATLLGVEPHNDRDGCLQDIHWMDGIFGYFPSYTIGAICAAQLYRAASQAIGTLETDIERGVFSRLLGWLRENVHAKASLQGLDDLMTSVCGEPITTAAFREYLTKRYCAERKSA